MIDRQAPAFEGVRTYCDPDGIFKIRHALNWHVYDLPEHPGGILFSPEPANPCTWLAAWKQDMGVSATPSDIRILAKGLDRGIRKLGKEVRLLSANQETIGHIVRLERIFTFEQDGSVHKRRQWVIFADHYEVVLLYHAQDEAEYDYWAGMASYSFSTFEIPEFLYFAAERRTAELAHDPVAGKRRRAAECKCKKITSGTVPV